jgi:hypothetical protein
MGGVELWLSQHVEAVRRETLDIESRRDRLKYERQSNDGLMRTTEAMSAEIAGLERYIEEAGKRLIYLESGLPRRVKFVPAFLAALDACISDKVYVESLDETEPYRIELTGWALSDSSAHGFFRALADKMAPLGLEVIDPSTRAGGGIGEGSDLYEMHVVISDPEVARPRIRRSVDVED